MALVVPNNGSTIFAGDVAQTVNIEQVPSGGQEVGQYFLAAALYASSVVASVSIRTLNHFSTPLSASVNTTGGQSPQAPTGGMGTVSIGSLTTDSCQIFSLATTGPNGNARAGGQYFLNF